VAVTFNVSEESVMPNSAVRQSLAFVTSFPAEIAEIRQFVSWPFGLALLGLAAALIAAGAEFPDFFAASLGHLGAEAP
jgi:hypothetical protein